VKGRGFKPEFLSGRLRLGETGREKQHTSPLA
jgi:hypothetical protein